MNVAAIKTYSNKSNAARAAKQANGGTLEGLELKGKEGAWYYQAAGKAPAPAPAAADSHTGDIVGQAAKVLHQAAVANETAAQMLEQAAPLVGAKAPSKAPSKAPAAKKGGKAAMPDGKEVASAYPSGVKGIKASERKGAARPRTKTGYHLQKERPAAHGVQRKSEGTVGAQLWALFDKLLAKLQAKDKKAGAKDLALSQVRGAGEEAGFNSTTVALAFYQWRRFNGVRGRGKKQKVDNA